MDVRKPAAQAPMDSSAVSAADSYNRPRRASITDWDSLQAAEVLSRLAAHWVRERKCSFLIHLGGLSDPPTRY
jgi:hypothetical protein